MAEALKGRKARSISVLVMSIIEKFPLEPGADESWEMSIADLKKSIDFPTNRIYDVLAILESILLVLL
jgi:hypothetical protein